MGLTQALIETEPSGSVSLGRRSDRAELGEHAVDRQLGEVAAVPEHVAAQPVGLQAEQLELDRADRAGRPVPQCDLLDAGRREVAGQQPLQAARAMAGKARHAEV